MTTKTSDVLTLQRALTLLAVTSSCRGMGVIDLTHRLREGEDVAWPNNPDYNFTILSRGHLPKYNNIWVEVNKFEMSDHMGTHMDAPSHMVKGGQRMHQIAAERLVGPGVVIDVKEKVKANPMYKVAVQDLEDWESQHGKMPDKAVVLVNFGWASRYPDKHRVFNTDNLQDLTSFRFPSVGADAASWLAEKRDIIAVGVETPSTDVGNDRRMAVHEILLKKNILVLENVANLNSLPPKGTTVVLGVLNIYEGSGAPMRMLAISGGWTPHSSPPSWAVLSLGMGVAVVKMLVQ